MTKVALKFIACGAGYNAGDIAAFDADHAEALIKRNLAVKAEEQPQALKTLTLAVDTREIDARIAEIEAEIEARELALAAREDALEERALEVLAREAALDHYEAIKIDDGTVQAGAETASEGLPAQGKKKA